MEQPQSLKLSSMPFHQSHHSSGAHLVNKGDRNVTGPPLICRQLPMSGNSCSNIFSSNGTIVVQVIVNSAFGGLFVNSSV
jgi:hypothetical protein